MTRECGALVTHAPADQKSSVAHYLEQAVAADIHAKVAAEHHLQFAHTDLGVAHAYLPHGLQYAVYLNRRLVAAPEALVICLSCEAKQSAGVINSHTGMTLAEATHRLAPDFFLMGMP